MDSSADDKGDDVRAALAAMVPKEVAQFAPLLIGKYTMQDKRAVWTGRWGMNEAAFGENGLTSAFEMKSDEDVYIRMASGDADSTHPVFTGAALAKSSRTENTSVEQVNPVYIGYEADASMRSAMPFDAKYTGFFQIQAVKGKPQTVAEKSVDIRFAHDVSRPSQFVVSGSGENRFGVFNLVGLLDKNTSEMRLYKIYKPKEKEKRTFPKRARTTRQVTTVPAPPKAPVRATPPLPPPAPASAKKVVTPVPSVASIVLPRVVSTPTSDTSSPSVGGRGRSERKRVMPAHLRDENVIEHDHVSPTLKKCHAILKSLMASPKAGPFLVPVDPMALGIPDYFDVIKEPMDLGTIRHNLEGGFYDDASVFVDHVRLVFNNAMLYNAAHSQVHIFAAKLSEDFEKRIKGLNLKHSMKEKLFERPSSSSVIKLKRDRKSDSAYSSKKIKGGRGAKGNTKRAVADDKEGLIMSLKEDIERLKAALDQLQPSALRVGTPKQSKAASRPFRMEDLTEEELNEPMTQHEKARLSADIRQLPQDKINRVLQIIAESVPVSKLANDNDEVEIDINSFDTRCLRMLEGYVRENGIGRKRKRPAPKKSSAPVSHRLKSAKVAALNIYQRKEELKNQLAAIDGSERPGSRNGHAVHLQSTVIEAMEVEKNEDDSSSDSSSSSSDSSDSDSDSDSESDSDGAPLHRSPMLTGGSTLSQISESGARADAKKIRDEVTTNEPLRVENRGAWSMLARMDSSNAQSLMQPEENQSSSLWATARTKEQEKQQKMQQQEKERNDELEQQRRREAEQREKEKKREREELERRVQEQEAELRLANEERVLDAERARAAQRVVDREKLALEEDVEDHHDHTLSEDLESFSSSSFL
ncbi:hypothetical protein Poli38472_008900 [Pythium oligandrum]|uniref:Bromodomain-containing protein n=1 Tax=Pythium oligandrum TaxID=41045 RepID=A0A8K1FE45_PYTOL|nr:hypothetical protein Poli38472_008900 [Pythium oligandrum]|eukprot:TMW56252.1 hypothetical protein Poli38472_008900 [Pythium oligandrum]